MDAGIKTCDNCRNTFDSHKEGWRLEGSESYFPFGYTQRTGGALLGFQRPRLMMSRWNGDKDYCSRKCLIDDLNQLLDEFEAEAVKNQP